MGRGMGTVAGVAVVPLMVSALLLWVLLFGNSSAAAACSPGLSEQLDVTALPADAATDGFDREQLVNAALVMNAAIALGLPPAAQTLGVQAAIGESGLHVLDHGDDAGPDSRGLFQQRDNAAWGTLADRMDPTISATHFFTALGTVTGWADLDPSLAINRVQGNADPDHYTQYRTDAVAIVTYLGGSGSESGCTVAGDPGTLASTLELAMQNGKLTFLEDRYAQQIRDVATGTASADCGIDVRTLQLIAIALQHFDTVGISDLNRRCTGSILGAGTESSHWVDGGGKAVDFYALNGTALTGGDPTSTELLAILDPLVPTGTRVGQVTCRPVTAFDHFSQFDDTCNHLHIDVAYTDRPLAIG